jgi:GNAT superfamily N-acetyltransferase
MEIRLIADGEDRLCNDFRNRIYGENHTLRQWRWEFAENTYDKRPIPYVVIEDGGKIIGTQAFIPIRMIDRDGIYWTAKSEATLLDPEYRGKRLFEKMYDLLFRYAEEHDFACIWGFTAAIKAFVRMGFTVPFDTEQIFLPFSTRAVASLLDSTAPGEKKSLSARAKIGLARTATAFARAVSAVRLARHRKNILEGLEIRTMPRADEQAGDLCGRFIDGYGGATIHRDAQYLQWRLFDNPYIRSVVKGAYRDGKLLGWAAYTIADDGMGYLVDLMAVGDDGLNTEDIVRALLIEAVIGCRNMGATGIRGWHVNDHPFDNLLGKVAKRIGFYHIKRGFSFVLYNCPESKNRPDHTDGKDWYISRIFTEGVFG